MEPGHRAIFDTYDTEWLRHSENQKRLHYRRTKLGEQGLEGQEKEAAKALDTLVNDQIYIDAVLANVNDADPETRREMELRAASLCTGFVRYNTTYSQAKRANEDRVKAIRYFVDGQELTFGQVFDIIRS